MKLLTFIAIALTCLSCGASAVCPSTDICYLLKNMSEFDGKRIELRSDVKFTMHGRHLFGTQCYKLGSVGLSIAEEKYTDRTVVDFVQKVMAAQGEAGVVLIGRFEYKSIENYKGYFVLEKVVEVNEIKRNRDQGLRSHKRSDQR